MNQSIDLGYKELLSEEQKRLTPVILQAAPVEMIYLVGTGYTHRKTDSIFRQTATCCQAISHYYILALINSTESANKNRVQDKIENNFQHYILTTEIVLELDKFEKSGYKKAIPLLLMYAGTLLRYTMPITIPFQRQRK